MEDDMQSAFQIFPCDNVATAPDGLRPGGVTIRGEGEPWVIRAVEEIAPGHKIALKDIPAGADIIKFGAVIGRATANTPMGAWVHLHNMRSLYDERSSYMDVRTGAPEDTPYE